MTYERIVCLDDLTRDEFWPAKEFIYDLVRAPILFASGLSIAHSPRRGRSHNLAESFDVQRFVELAGGDAGTHWASGYHQLPPAAHAYLVEAIPKDTLVIGYEMTPALKKVLADAGCDHVDIRVSPLRFGADLYIGLSTNSPAIYRRIVPLAMQEHEVVAEACLMAAQVRYRRRYTPEAPRWDGALVWVGQTAQDASLIGDDGRFLRAADAAPAIREAAQGRRLVYKAHPYAGPFGREEHAQLVRITGQDIAQCELDAYELLAMDDELSLIGISSSLLQEASYFGKPASWFRRPECTPDFSFTGPGGGHLHVATHVFMSEALWASILDRPPRAQALCLPPRPNHLRELHNAWWGYSTLQLRHSNFHREAVQLHAPAPAALAPRDDSPLQQALALERQRVDDLRLEVEGLKEALRVVLRHATPRTTADLATAA